MEKIIEIKFNLQRFAVGDNETSSQTMMNVNTTTSNGMKAEILDYYNSELLRGAKENFIYNQFAKHTRVPLGNGHSVKWRRMKPYKAALTPLTEGVTPAGNTAVFEDIHATTNQYGDYTVITDRVKMETFDPMVTEISAAHAEQAALTIDTLTRNEIMTGTTKMLAPKWSGSTPTEVLVRKNLDITSRLTLDLFSKAKTILKKNKAKTINGSYIAVIHPDLEHDVTTDKEGFIDVVKYRDSEKIYNGEIGKWYGVRILTNNNAKVWRDDTCPANPNAPESGGEDYEKYLAVYGVVVFGLDAFADVKLAEGDIKMIIKQVGSSGVDDALDQRGSIGWKVPEFAAKILNDLHIVRIECTSPTFSESEIPN